MRYEALCGGSFGSGNSFQSSPRPLPKMEFMERFQALEDFQPEDKEAVIKLIDAMIVHEVEGALKPLEKRAG